MPLSSIMPVIDDRRYDDIVAEIRTRVARYTPEWTPVWTDVNDNDPGVTLAQLFAWLSDMLLYRLGQVPEMNYIKFLQLLGIELNPAEPAHAEVTFPVQTDFPDPSLIIPSRTQVAADLKDGSPPVIFETTRSLVALAAQLSAVYAFDGYAFTPVTGENADATVGYQPFGPRADVESALLLGFTSTDDLPAIQLDLYVLVAESASGIPAVQCGLPATAVLPSVDLRWEFWNGTDWQRLSLLKDETRALTRTGHILLKLPAKGMIKLLTLSGDSAGRYWLRGRIVKAGYEQPPTIQAIRTNTVEVEQAQSVQDEVLGGSDGSRNQTFQLANAPVLDESLQLDVDEGEGFLTWQEVPDFFGSGPRDQVYMLNRTDGTVRFGDGINGAIPVGNVDNPTANIVARQYRFGGGQRGNVKAGLCKTLLTTIDGVDENAIANLMAAYGGRDEEQLAEAQKRAPSVIQSNCRAVTAKDFEFFARQAANIKRAHALPLYHPRFPDDQVPGVVTVVVVPDSEAPNPVPSDGTLRTVCAYLDQRRLLTTELYVMPPTYQQVQVSAEVIAADDADLAAVTTGIEQALLNYFHPLKGGEDNLGWPFGGTIFYSRVYQRVFTVDGVDSITDLSISLDGETAPACKDVPIQKGALVFSTVHQVQVNYAVENNAS